MSCSARSFRVDLIRSASRSTGSSLTRRCISQNLISRSILRIENTGGPTVRLVVADDLGETRDCAAIRSETFDGAGGMEPPNQEACFTSLGSGDNEQFKSCRGPAASIRFGSI